MRVIINGADHDVDPGQMSFDEGIHIEDVTGLTFTEFGNLLSRGSMKAMRAYALILIQRTDNSVTLADVGRMSMSALEFVQEEADSKQPDAVAESIEDPTPAE